MNINEIGITGIALQLCCTCVTGKMFSLYNIVSEAILCQKGKVLGPYHGAY